MKEVTRISLASVPYNSDIDAKKELEKYLHAIEVSLDADADTMKEIEARIAELLADRGVTGDTVISLDNVIHVREQLGDPKDFASDPLVTATDSPQQKRLMRSHGDEMFGGVCAGIAAYFGIDTVWVRLAFIILFFVTSGFMLLIYIVLWIVTPPAKTAADRLQMKGKPITLSSLQVESEIIVAGHHNDKTAALAVRIFSSAMASIVGISGIAAIGFVWWYVSVARTGQVQGQDWIYVGLMTFAGVLFSIFCWVGAYMLFVGKTTRRLWISLAFIAVLGFTTFLTGALPFSLNMQINQERQADAWQKSAAQQSIDVSSLAGAKQLTVNANVPVQINYNADPSRAAQGTLRYHALEGGSPTVKLTRQGEVVSVNVEVKDTTCMPVVPNCQLAYTVTLVGPQLAVVEATNSSVVHYTVDGQDALQVTTVSNAEIQLVSMRPITNLNATVGNESRLVATEASVTYAQIVTEGRLSSAHLATLKSLTITLPESCTEGASKGEISYAYAENILVNGQSHKVGQKYPCGGVTSSTDSES
jgi:phage shock protein PspC (stress-responsive transcriptional regulator)